MARQASGGVFRMEEEDRKNPPSQARHIPTLKLVSTSQRVCPGRTLVVDCPETSGLFFCKNLCFGASCVRRRPPPVVRDSVYDPAYPGEPGDVLTGPPLPIHVSTVDSFFWRYMAAECR